MTRLIPWGRVLAVVATVAALFATGEILYSVGIGTLRETIRGSLARRQAVIRPLPLPCGRAATLQGAKRQIGIQATEGKLNIQLELILPVDHPCAKRAFGSFGVDQLAFITAAFGRISVNSRELTEVDLGPPQVLRAPKGAPTARLRFQMIRPFSRTAHLMVVRPPNTHPPTFDRFTAAWGPGISASIWADTLPDLKTSNRLSIEAKAPQTIPQVILSLGTPPSNSRASRDGAKTQQSYFRRLGTTVSFPVLTPLLLGLSLALPLLLSLPRLRLSADLASLTNRFAEATGALLLFQLTIYLVIACNEVRGFRLFLVGENKLTEWLREVLPVQARHPFGQSVTYLTCIMLGIALPVLVWSRMNRASPQVRTFLCALARGSLLLAAGGLTASGGIGLAQRLKWLPGDPAILLTLGLGLLLLTALFALLVRLSGGAVPVVSSPNGVYFSHRLGGLASICVLTFVLLASLDTLLDVITWESLWGSAPIVFWAVVTSILGAMLISSLVKPLRSLSDGLVPLPTWLSRPDVRTLSTLALLLAAAPLPFFLSPSEYFVSAATLSHLAILVAQWVLPVWLVGITALLYQKGRESLAVGTDARFLGLLGVATVLYSPRITWLYIPATFLLGWWTLEWLLVPKQERLFLTRPYDGKQLPRLLATVIDLNAAMHAVRGHRRKQLAAMLKGEVDFATYEREREERIAKLASLRQQATLEDQNAEDLVLSFAPHESAWANGVHGAKWAFFFSLPWLLLGSADLLRAPASETPYPLWAFGDDIFLLALKWVTIGFLLGYFFPYLRGQSGLVKGLYLFLGLTLPTLPLATILNSTTNDWQATFFWYLQTLIHCMLLGLFAFDNIVLRQGGQRDWRLLFEVHGLPALGFSLSTLAVAIGTAITTLITSQIPGLVGLALRFTLPQIEWPSSSGGPGSP